MCSSVFSIHIFAPKKRRKTEQSLQEYKEKKYNKIRKFTDVERGEMDNLKFSSSKKGMK